MQPAMRNIATAPTTTTPARFVLERRPQLFGGRGGVAALRVVVGDEGVEPLRVVQHLYGGGGRTQREEQRGEAEVPAQPADRAGEALGGESSHRIAQVL